MAIHSPNAIKGKMISSLAGYGTWHKISRKLSRKDVEKRRKSVKGLESHHTEKKTENTKFI